METFFYHFEFISIVLTQTVLILNKDKYVKNLSNHKRCKLVIHSTSIVNFFAYGVSVCVFVDVLIVE